MGRVKMTWIELEKKTLKVGVVLSAAHAPPGQRRRGLVAQDVRTAVCYCMLCVGLHPIDLQR